MQNYDSLVRSARTPSVLSPYLDEKCFSISQRAKAQLLRSVLHVAQANLVPGDPAASSREAYICFFEKDRDLFRLDGVISRFLDGLLDETYQMRSVWDLQEFGALEQLANFTCRKAEYY
jgi:hypothetical protein